MSCALDPSIQLYDICKRIPFYDSCQFTITWVFTIKLNTDCVCLERRAPALIQNIKSLTYMKSWFYLQFTVRKERIPKECLTFSYNNSHEP